jgi:hypothetical protein
MNATGLHAIETPQRAASPFLLSPRSAIFRFAPGGLPADCPFLMIV